MCVFLVSFTTMQHLDRNSSHSSLVYNFQRMIKYGVVQMHDLVQDLLKWESFYLSGRLQKPVCESLRCAIFGLSGSICGVLCLILFIVSNHDAKYFCNSLSIKSAFASGH